LIYSILCYREACARLIFIGGLERVIATGTLVSRILFGVCEVSMLDGPKTHVVYHAVPRDSAIWRCYIFVNNQCCVVVTQSAAIAEGIRQLLQTPDTLCIVNGGFQQRCMYNALRYKTIHSRFYSFEKARLYIPYGDARSPTTRYRLGELPRTVDSCLSGIVHHICIIILSGLESKHVRRLGLGREGGR
jgi:hypothetical protein